MRRLLAPALLVALFATGCSSGAEPTAGGDSIPSAPSSFVPRGGEASEVSPVPVPSLSPSGGFFPFDGAGEQPTFSPSSAFPSFTMPTYKDFTLDEILAAGVSKEAAASLAVGRLLFRASLSSSPQAKITEMAAGLAQRAGTLELEALQLNVGGAVPTGVLLNETPFKSGVSGSQLLFKATNTLTVVFKDQQCSLRFNNSHPQPEEYMWFQLYPEPVDTAKSIVCTPI